MPKEVFLTMYREIVNLSILYQKSGNGKHGCKICQPVKFFRSAKGLALHLGKSHENELNKSEKKFIYKTARSLERARK